MSSRSTVRVLLLVLGAALAVALVAQAVRISSVGSPPPGPRPEAPSPPAPGPSAENRPPSPFFPAHRSSQAVLAWLDAGDPAKLDEAVTACLEVGAEAPDNVFNSMLLAFCYGQGGDPSREEAVAREAFPDAVPVYDFLFKKNRAVLPEALRLLPAFKCYCLRQELGHLDRPELCPVDGTPFTKSTRREGDRDLAVYSCAACDAVFDPARMPALMPVYEQATQDVVARNRIATWRPGGDPVTAAEFFHLLGFQKGQAVADIGCGLGNFVFPFAREVGPEGKVYAEEIEPGFLEVLAYGVSTRGTDNVIPVLGRPDDVGLPEKSIDRAFLCEVYKSATTNTGNLDPEEFERSVSSFFASIHRALKDDGQLVIINRRAPALGMAAGPIQERLEGLHFRLVRSLEDFPREDVLFFEKVP